LVGSLVRKTKTSEFNNASVAIVDPLWDSILRDILIPRLVEATGDSSFPYDADTFRALLAPEASTAESAGSQDVAAAPGAESADTILAGAAQPAALMPVEAFNWLQPRFGSENHQGGVSGPSHIALAESGLGTAIGAVSMGSLGADIAALAKNVLINFGDRAIVGASEGDLAGGLFLVIDANGREGFQYGEDEILVIFKGLPSTDLAVDLPLF
jgi:hypothetical protein